MEPNETTPPASTSSTPSSPNPPRRRPWGLYALAGCLTLLATGFAVGVIVVVGFTSRIAREVGPVNPTTMRQKLGKDVPLYPGSTLDHASTTAMLATFSLSSRFVKDQETELLGSAVYHTDANQDTVWKFYSDALAEQGWAEAVLEDESALGEDELYVFKGDNGLWLSIAPDDTNTGTDITLSRYRYRPLEPAPDDPAPETVPAAEKQQ